MHPQFGTKGDPGPFIVHKDKSKKKDEDCYSNADRHGPKPPVIVPAKERFKKGLFDSEKRSGESGTSKNPMGTSDVSTSGGSMTQITFYNYAQHFIANLSTDHEPVIRF